MKLTGEDAIKLLLNQNRITFCRQYRFDSVRQFKFDFAIPEYRIAVEYEGGTWTGGGHVRGKVYSSNCEKYNLAAIQGWRVLRYTSDVLATNPGKIIDDIKTLITNDL
jgi:very-short-patch-repair endonuclease